MQIAHVLIKCDDKNDKTSVDKLKSIKEIKHIEQTFGPYDAVIRLESESNNTIKHIIRDKIRNVTGIQSTLTLVNL
ncbi:MAG: Lrp/AsnC ligand binding domain-containing protein [Nitrosopumilus sp.]|nr:Lrp/AsnC ligand binding domain-containing protein [Nitrosopumilus sp.]